MQQEIRYIKIIDLHLWTENPRDPIDISSSDFDIISKAIKDDEEKWNLDKLSNKMGTHYDFSELPTVVEENGKYIVYDGNRRLALIKTLQNEVLYHSFMQRFFSLSNADNFKNLKEIPCNLCDKQTALNNIERKHADNGSWKVLERDYFLYKHRNKEKSDFIIINEATRMIENNPKMNQLFVKDEVLKNSNLNQLGFSISDGKLLSVYEKDDAKLILDSVISAVKDEKISTRANRGKIVDTILEHNPQLKTKIKQFSSKENKGSLVSVDYGKEITPSKKRKTSTTKQPEKLFGETLSLKTGKTNDLYVAIDKIYNANSNDNFILPIIGMSLRLLVEIAAREDFEFVNQREIKATDLKIYDNFIKKAKQNLTQEMSNFNAVTQNWLNSDENIEGILGKYAHGQIPYEKANILKVSYVVADFLKYYFSKN